MSRKRDKRFVKHNEAREKDTLVEEAIESLYKTLNQNPQMQNIAVRFKNKGDVLHGLIEPVIRNTISRVPLTEMKITETIESVNSIIANDGLDSLIEYTLSEFLRGVKPMEISFDFHR